MQSIIPLNVHNCNCYLSELGWKELYFLIVYWKNVELNEAR